ncbi:MAG: DMT family transporter [Bacteroides sp.]|jgi:drug/metabolite transporter (DMT)-like permease|nr:DMT family transporter [Bacteroides sp.]
MNQARLSVYIRVILAVTFWGISYVWTKMVFEFYSPVTTMFLRLAISSVLLFGIFRKQLQHIDPKDYTAFFIMSFFSPFCYFIGESFGLLHVSPTVASVIIATIPVFTPILGFIAFSERLSWINILGFFISFTGVMVMVLDAEFKFSASPLGIGLLFFAVLSALINVIFLKKLTVKYSSFTIISVQNLVGALLFLPLFLIFDFSDFLQIRPSGNAIASIIALAVFGSTLAFMFYTSGVRTLGIARSSIFTNLIPVVTAVTSWMILKENIDASKMIGMAIVISGLMLTQLTRLQEKRRIRPPLPQA